MKISYSLCAVVCVVAVMTFVNFTPALAQGITSDSIVGKWKDADEGAVVQIENKGTYYEGVVVENPEHPEVVSTTIFKNLVYDSTDGVWKGQVYSVKRQKDYDAEIQMSDANNFSMKVKAGLGSKTVGWSRVQ